MLYKNRLKEIREENNTPEKDIAKYLNITQSVYSHYETEYNIIPSKHLIKIADYYNVSIDYLFEFTNTKNYKNSKKGYDKELFNKRLKEFRKEHKLTQNKLAKELNTTFSVISGYEIGRRLIATPFLYTICKKYNLSTDYLLGKIDKPIYRK